MPVILTVIFLLSLSGYYLAYGLFVKRHVSFFPVLFTAFTVLILYVFGLAGILMAGFYLILGLGMLLIPFSIFKKKDGIIPLLKETVLDPSLLFIMIGTVWIYFLTKGVSLAHHDDFSHWYKICKMMHFENAYPTQPDTLFTTYVPGTATWIWFITSITGFSPDKCFFAHSLINLAALNSFFSLSNQQKDKLNALVERIMLFFFVSVISVLLCSMDVNTYCLLTDTTLALIPMAAVFFVLSENNGFDSTDTVLFTSLMCFEGLIKVAGIPFLIFVCIYRNLHSKKHFSSSRLSVAAYNCLPIGIASSFFLAYLIRAKVVFGSFENSSQGLSLARYITIFSRKTDIQVKDIIVRFLYEMFDFFGVMSMQVRLLWIVFAFLLISFLFVRKRIKTNKILVADLWEISPMLFVFFAAYSAFLLMTYLFSMNDQEANADLLNCFYRYIGSVTIFITGIVFYLLYRIVAKMDKRKVTLTALIMCSISIAISIFMFDIGYIFGYSHYHPVKHFTTASWDLLKKYASENNYYTDESYFIIYREEDVRDSNDHKTRMASAAYFRSNNVYALSIDDLKSDTLNEDNRRLLGNCDYLVTLGDFSDQLDVIGNYVDVKDYRPGMISLKD